MADVYTHKFPQNPHSCVVFNSPHSGSQYPAAFMETTKLDSLAIRSSEDAFVHELFMDAPEYGAHLLFAHAPRAFVDLNRRADELDPAIVRGVKRGVTNPRIAAGLGVIPRVVGNGQVIRSGKITLAEAEQRIAMYYTPYHAYLAELLANQRAQHGMSILIDCHSMPQRSLDAAPLVRGRLPDVVLGDRFGTSCDRWIMDAATQVFEAAGFIVARNAPFSGGYITQHYGGPSKNIHALQIEINRSLYMDETAVRRSENFDEMRKVMSTITGQLAQVGPVCIDLAAE